jgi:recombination protein RecT
MSLPPAVQQAQGIILAQEQQFNSLVVDDKIKFAAESQFACQLMRANSYLAGIATKNPQSMIDAVNNIAAISVSLNPALKHAYLVPRDGKVCLDISYMGLLHIATDSGSIMWGQAKLVYAKDLEPPYRYVNMGINKEPDHQFAAFGDRGPIVGAYCTVKTAGGDFLTEEMSIDQIKSVANRSAAFKKNSGPWKTDYEEMVRKTVVKRAYKYWPRCERIGQAIDYLNKSGEGIDFDNERREAGPVDVNLTPEQIEKIASQIDELGTTRDIVLGFAASNLFKRDVQSLAELTKDEASKLSDLLSQRLGQQKHKREKPIDTDEVFSD